jgi:hypothetical protein
LCLKIFLRWSKIRWSPLCGGYLFAVGVFAAPLLAQDIVPDKLGLPHYPYSLNYRRVVFAAPKDTVTIALPDSFVIAKSDTLRWRGRMLQRGRDYQINYRDARFHWLQPDTSATVFSDSLVLTYRIFPLALPRQIALFRLAKPAANDSALALSNFMTSAGQDYRTPSESGRISPKRQPHARGKSRHGSGPESRFRLAPANFRQALRQHGGGRRAHRPKYADSAGRQHTNAERDR